MRITKATIAVLATVFMIITTARGAGVEDASKIDLNTATVKKLATLKRVGQKYAQRIVEYREQNGLFKDPREITKVRGIGKKTYEENKDRLMVTNQP